MQENFLKNFLTNQKQGKLLYSWAFYGIAVLKKIWSFVGKPLRKSPFIYKVAHLTVELSAPTKEKIA